MNDILNYNYKDKILNIELLQKNINLQNYIQLKDKLASLKLSRVDNIIIDMKNVEKIDETGLDILKTYKYQLSYLNIDVQLLGERNE